ncbi:MAG: methylmalonyl-CoA mutase family protein, partial [Planctomycetota bacterium]|nr:methylmalonyl-CoA mutase family protein [Planctomycetota bacterium]
MPDQRPPRFVLATPICDGHDVAVCAVTRMLRAEGAEAVYIGFNKSPQQIVKAAVEEDATAIALSSYNGGHMSFVRETLKEKERQGIPATPLFLGGGGTVLAREVAPLERLGVAHVYRPPLDLGDACRDMIRRSRTRRGRTRRSTGDHPWLALARQLTRIEHGKTPAGSRRARRSRQRRAPVWSVAGRGGAGKSTLVDELLLRFLEAARGDVAVLCIDPTLGDRLRMLHCYSPRVFLRSVSLRPGEALEPRLGPMIDALRNAAFELVLVESVGLGQNDLGVAPLVDGTLYCMTPEYGTNVQLEKEALLERADVIVMNKSDYPQAIAKGKRVRQHLREDQEFVSTRANRHRDEGVTQLFRLLSERAGIDCVELTGAVAGEEVAGSTVPFARRAYLGEVVAAHEDYYREMEREIGEAERDPRQKERHVRQFRSLWETYGFDGDPREGQERSADGNEILRRNGSGDAVPVARRTTCGIWVPSIGLPPRDAGLREIVTYLYKQNVPGSFPFTEGTHPYRRTDEDPIRMFAGLGLPETTNERFHLLAARAQAAPRKPPRLSTAFDSLTLYGLDSDEAGALAKVGEGGVALDTIEDMERLYAGFDLEATSVSLTMNGPRPR